MRLDVAGAAAVALEPNREEPTNNDEPAVVVAGQPNRPVPPVAVCPKLTVGFAAGVVPNNALTEYGNQSKSRKVKN